MRKLLILVFFIFSSAVFAGDKKIILIDTGKKVLDVNGEDF